MGVSLGPGASTLVGEGHGKALGWVMGVAEIRAGTEIMEE